MGGKNRQLGSVGWLIFGSVLYKSGQGVGRILIIVFLHVKSLLHL